MTGAERRRTARLGRTGWFFLAAALSGLLLLALPPLPGNGRLYLVALWLLGLVGAGALEIVRLVDGEWHLLAARLGRRPPHAPAKYVRALFDTYAPRFDEHLMVELAYAAPNGVRDLLDAPTVVQPVDTLVDLGCGTGVMAPLCRSLARTLVGVDLSPRMLARADARRLYDRLEEGDIVGFLQRHDAAFDLLIAVDVVVYIGDLRPLLVAAARALQPGGHFAFTTELLGEGDYRLRRSGRFAHCGSYVESLVREVGLEVERALQRAVRTEADQPVQGGLYLVRRPSGPVQQKKCDACIEVD
jgi:predicted TPR repeat methyltransferase